MVKDYFSEGSQYYARYRPQYPSELFSYLEQVISRKERAWDCGTGNGQIAYRLADFMGEVLGTDISAAQLKNAFPKRNVRYLCKAAENSGFPDGHFDLITVGQAIHWFDFDVFYSEAKRVLKPGGVMAVIGYGLFSSNPETDRIIRDFYEHIIGSYWDSRRVYLEEGYKTIPFPFDEIPHPDFRILKSWSLERLLGYLSTWSAVRHYRKKEGSDPLIALEQQLRPAFGTENVVEFPVLVRIGR